MFIISFTGPGSSGKSTLLNHLKEKNDNLKFNFCEEVTRKVKREDNVEINELGGSTTQKLIIFEHIANLVQARQSDAVTILDRCMFDGVIYSLYLYKLGNISGEVAEQINDISEFFINQRPYDILFYPDPDDVVLEDDGERSTSAAFRNDISSAYSELWRDINLVQPIIKLSGTVEERLQLIQKTLADRGIHIDI